MLELSSKTFQTIEYRAPSNIAFIKYWGKYGRQYPMNPSLSMSLSNCYTQTKINYIADSKSPGLKNLKFENKPNELFFKKIKKFTESIIDILPTLKTLEFEIESYNSFPHSTGIASSASSMAALACCLVEVELGKSSGDDFDKLASIVARLGSGSACRSIFDDYAHWGETKTGSGSNEYAIELKEYHENFKHINDAILIVSSDEKSVSSTQGHSLMNTHLYREVREFQANENYRTLLNAMINGDFKCFGEILENEALSLHALMMTSYPSFILLTPKSLELIELIRSFRAKTNLNLYFTIDAGPNIHLIYPDTDKLRVEEFIKSQCEGICEKIIFDKKGDGATKIS